MVRTLEETLRAQQTLRRAQAMPLEVYIAKFTLKYQNESKFRANVHKSMGLSRRARFKLAIEKRFRPAKYKQDTTDLIIEYAKEARQKTIEYAQVLSEQETTFKTEQDLATTSSTLETIQKNTEKAGEEYSELERRKEEEKQRALAELEQKNKEEAERREREKEAIQLRTDAERIAKEKVQAYINRTGLITTKESGEVEYNDGAFTEFLENRVLDEVVGEVEKESGKTGFLAKTKKEYDGLISHYDEMEDWSELPDMDLSESISNARRKGYRVPRRMRHFIVGKYEKKRVNGKLSLDSALAIDLSGSMKGPKFQAAKKVGLSMNALMRKLNPQNKRYMAGFNSSVWDLTSLDLMRNSRPRENTRTDLALSWGLEKLKDSPLSMFYLLTDGYPEPYSAYIESLKIASKFKEYPQIKLRIFYVGNSSDSKDMIKELATASGPATKLSVVDVDRLASGIVSDFGDCIHQMSRVEEF
jgi:hypothetical protein